MRRQLTLTFSILTILMLTGCSEVPEANNADIINTKDIQSNIDTSLIDSRSLALSANDVVTYDKEITSVEAASILDISVSEASDSAAISDTISYEAESTLEVTQFLKPSYSDIVNGSVSTGNIVAFGRYEQDNNLENGPEPINWLVLEVSNGSALLLPTDVIMSGKGIECEEKIEQFTSIAFSEYEADLIIEEPKLIDRDIFEKANLLILRSSSGSVYYAHDNRFEFMKNYSASVAAEGLVPTHVNVPGGPDVDHYMIWTNTCCAAWSVSKDNLNNTLLEATALDRTRDSYHTYGISPYIVISTNELSESEVD